MESVISTNSETSFNIETIHKPQDTKSVLNYDHGISVTSSLFDAYNRFFNLRSKIETRYQPIKNLPEYV